MRERSTEVGYSPANDFEKFKIDHVHQEEVVCFHLFRHALGDVRLSVLHEYLRRWQYCLELHYRFHNRATDVDHFQIYPLAGTGHTLTLADNCQVEILAEG